MIIQKKKLQQKKKTHLGKLGVLRVDGRARDALIGEAGLGNFLLLGEEVGLLVQEPDVGAE